MPKSSQKTSELGKNDHQDPFSSQEDMTLDVFIWDYSWHYFLFTSRVVCSAERDFYPPGIPLTHGANGLGSFRVFSGPVSLTVLLV